MTTLLVAVWLGILVLLVVTLAMQPVKSKHSWFELRRRSDDLEMQRELMLSTIGKIRWIVAGILVAILAVVTVAIWQWWSLAVAAIVILLLVPGVRFGLVRRLAARLYGVLEPYLLRFGEARFLLTWLGAHEKPRDQKIESAEQLLHLVDGAGSVLSENQKNIIRNGIYWHETSISDVMVPRKQVVSVKFSELIGPLVLNDLHSTGHKRFPVTRKGLDGIVGLLDITSLVEVSARSRSQTAEELMTPGVLRIEDDATLPEALSMLQKSHAHMLIVVDSDGKTAGLVTLADITRSLLGNSK